MNPALLLKYSDWTECKKKRRIVRSWHRIFVGSVICAHDLPLMSHRFRQICICLPSAALSLTFHGYFGVSPCWNHQASGTHSYGWHRGSGADVAFWGDFGLPLSSVLFHLCLVSARLPTSCHYREQDSTLRYCRCVLVVAAAALSHLMIIMRKITYV